MSISRIRLDSPRTQSAQQSLPRVRKLLGPRAPQRQEPSSAQVLRLSRSGQRQLVSYSGSFIAHFGRARILRRDCRLVPRALVTAQSAT